MLSIDLSCAIDQFTLAANLTLPDSGVTAIYGHNGSGKTTLLRCLAGLQDASGRIALADEVWLDSDRGHNLPTHRRPLGYVFQDLRLFPHLSVAGNLEFARKRRPTEDRYAEEVMALLNMKPLLQRYPADLSGGEQQRAALARSLITQPRLLLLDEPTAALDPHARRETLRFIQRIATEMSVPIVLVSHAVDEVASIANHTVVLHGGSIATSGPTAEIVGSQTVLQIAGRGEVGSVIHARCDDYDTLFQMAHLAWQGQTLALPSVRPLSPGTTVRLFVHARDVSIALTAPTDLSIRNAIGATVQRLEDIADTPFAMVTLQVGSDQLMAQITRAAANALKLASGMRCWALLKSASFDLPV